ncbi:MAG: hypothetical protein JKY37_00840 [Nannocystaceae bacterium]|nr:hypothetical protein [Nannocystaceae bacterium]
MRSSPGGVEFIVVGGIAAVLHGAPISTRDLDIVHARHPRNVERLLVVLDELCARVRDPAGRDLQPSEQALLGTGQSLLMTRLSPLDCLGALHDGRDFDALVEHTIELSDDSLTIRVLDLRTLIAVKTEAGRPRDLLVVPLLEAILKQD